MSDLDGLKASVDSWLVRDDVAVTGTDFTEILLIAEAELATDVRCGVQETTTSLVFTGRSVDLPADFLEMRNPFIDDNVRKIAYMTPKAIREVGPWATGRTGSFYTVEGGGGTAPDDRMQVTIAAPASVAEPLTIDVNYYKRFAALVAGPDTNWLLNNHYNIYLYATLRAAAEYIQEDALEDRYKGKYDEATFKMARQENRKRWGATPKQAYGSPRAIV